MPIEYKNKKWIIGATRNMSFWHQDVTRGYFRSADFGIPETPQNGSITFEGTKTDVFFEERTLQEFGDSLVALSLDPERVSHLESSYKSFGREFLKSISNLSEGISVQNLEAFLDQYERYSAGLLITLIMGREVSSALSRKLTLLARESIDHIVSIITYPEENSPLLASRLELLKIAVSLKGKQDPEKLKELLQDWLLTFQHIPVNFCEDPWSLEDAEKQFDEIVKGDPKREYDEIVKNHENKIKEKENLLKKIDDKEVFLFARALSKCGFLNEFRKNVFSKVSLEYRPVFAHIAKLGGSLDWRDCFYLRREEMVDLLAGKDISLSWLKEKRQIAGLISEEKGKIELIPEKDLPIFMQHHSSLRKIEKAEKSTSDFLLKGTSANKGKVRGRVKVVLHRGEFSKFEKGDILVSVMTSVDFVPIMGMASAFVTDEGGITSHASIVSREMNKPCIIGTKIATRVLKDGMMVEVDADRGIVTII